MRSISSSILLLLPTLSYAFTFDCEQIIEDHITWNLKPLAGYHQVSWVRPHVDLVYNTTFKLDLCTSLELQDEAEKKGCGHGTRVCGVENHIEPDDKIEHAGAWPIAREYFSDGAHMEPKYRRLKTTGDKDEEGIRVELGGGVVNNKKQKVVIEFVCLREKEDESRKVRRDEKEDDDDKKKKEWEAAATTKDGHGGTIQFINYDDQTLELEWKTPYGCEDAAKSPPNEDKKPVEDGDKDKDGDEPAPSGGWGFFSWFFFIVFMLLLAFIAFTAWVNYTRNGARGWDLLPFSDTLQDLPYILGDWSRKIASTLGGGGNRGGYSAV